ncbi:hypothetical protein F2P56_024759 [Juglans regia]|uniref:Uncharacterized protein n=1 Tax=Juglans regia TaxID=51240 RepID=A0A833X9G0_JUGRE|nr:hypothetical protein F2P56_024759 [Juglans regia]
MIWSRDCKDKSTALTMEEPGRWQQVSRCCGAFQKVQHHPFVLQTIAGSSIANIASYWWTAFTSASKDLYCISVFLNWVSVEFLREFNPSCNSVRRVPSAIRVNV